LGDEIANELVEWFNQVDATYCADLRVLIELNPARFGASLKQQNAELKARLNRRITDLRTDLIKWMFGFWIGTLAPLAGLLVLLTR
jgi:hypothetical protein